MELKGRQAFSAAIGHPGWIFLDCLAAMLLVAALAAVPAAWYPDAYFTDDMQSQYMPTFYAIGATLREAGQIPLFTLRSWYGGNLAGEYQYALFNPLALAAFAVLPSFSTLQAGAAFLGIFFTAIFGSGALFCARMLGVTRPLSYVAAVAIGTNGFVFYWYASSWFPGLISLAFLGWAMGFLLAAHRDGWMFLGAGLATALVATAGWPHTLLVLALFITIIIALRVRRREMSLAMRPALAAGAGVAMAAVAIAPLIQAVSVGARYAGFLGRGRFVPSLTDVLSFTNPFHFGRMLGFQDYTAILTPTFYAAWFVVPILCLLDWKKARRDDFAVGLISIFGTVLMIATLGPEQLWTLRWPFRFLPVFHMSLILGSLLLLSKTGIAIPSRRRLIGVFGALTLDTLISIQGAPASAPLILFALILIVGGVLALTAAAPGRPLFMAYLMGSVTAAFPLVYHLVQPHNPETPHWNFELAPAGPIRLDTVPASYEIYLNRFGEREEAGQFDRSLWGQHGLALDRATINGYSPIQQKGLTARFCIEGPHGVTCPAAIIGLFDNEETSGASLADLMRVDRIVVHAGKRADRAAALAGPTWHREELGNWTVALTRNLPNAALPGSLSWPSTGVTALEAGEPTALREQLHILQRDSQVNRLIFARSWWPGYQASFNGVPVAVHPLADFLVAVDLPATPATGDLILSYAPPGFAAAIAVSLLASIFLILGAVCHGRLRWFRQGLPA